MPGIIYIGTSGYSYDEWRGVLYPAALGKALMLNHYSRFFNCVEINFTYYREPTTAILQGMEKKTPENFKFVVKATKAMTHERTEGLPAFKRFCTSLTPLIQSGKFGAVLAQFPWGFKNTAENQDYLKRFRDYTASLPVVIEFRNNNWINEQTIMLLQSLELNFCCVDEPDIPSLPPRCAWVTGAIGYVRFHSRDATRWWNTDTQQSRYDYLYTQPELQEWVPKIQSMNTTTRETYVFFNNHHHGNAVSNARDIQALLIHKK